MASFDQTFPPLLAQLHRIEFDDGEGEGIDFEPYQEFQSAEDNADWIQAWTGNKELTGAEYRVFGQDGTGGYAAFWLVRSKQPVLEQPVVFFGSEGELGVVAANFRDYLWLLAAGIGPYEAIVYGVEDDYEPHEELGAFAKKNGGPPRRPVDIIATARQEFPEFEATVEALKR